MDLNSNSTPAGLPLRLLALFYDTLLIIAVWMVGTAILLPFTGGEAITGIWRALYQLYILALTFGFFSLFWLRGGQTLGMKTWKLRVLRNDDKPMTLKDAAYRFSAASVSLLPAGAGLLWCLFSDDRQALHDRLSNTKVVRLPPQA